MQNCNRARLNQSVIEAIFSSFLDVPGRFKEEMQEITISTGLEYWYNKKFALRTGYSGEAENKGNQRFFTTGAGVRMSYCSIDFSYLVPTIRNNPLANTIRFTILFDADSFKKTGKKYLGVTELKKLEMKN